MFQRANPYYHRQLDYGAALRAINDLRLNDLQALSERELALFGFTSPLPSGITYGDLFEALQSELRLGLHEIALLPASPFFPATIPLAAQERIALIEALPSLTAALFHYDELSH